VTALPNHSGDDSTVMALVRETISREVSAASSGGHIMYRRTSDSPQGAESRDVIETRDWTIGRLVQLDGTDLSPERQREEVARLEAIRSDSAALRKLAASLYQDEERVRRIMASMPNALQFIRAGWERSATGRTGIRLAFRPRPGFRPPTRESMLLTALEGTMVIDSAAHRLTSIDATLTRDVTLGWGVFGRLNRGGHAVVRQQKVTGNRWAITTLQLRIDGTAFLIRRLRIRTNDTSSGFVPMDDNLSLAEGIARLLGR